MSHLRAALRVAWFEFTVTVRRASYLAVTLGLPILAMAFALAVGATAAGVMAPRSQRAEETPKARAVAVVDDSGLVAAALRARKSGGNTFEVSGRAYAIELLTDLAAAEEQVRNGAIRGFVHLPADLREGGVVRYYTSDRLSPFDPVRAPPVAPWLAAALLEGKVADPVRRLAVERPYVEVLALGDDGAFVPDDPLAALGEWATPMGLVVFLLVAIVTSSSYLLQGLVDEKDNRVLEILLSSTDARPLLAGKLVGLGAAGLLQALVWLGLAVVLWFRFALAAAPGTLAVGALYFVLGYLLLGSLMLGFGSLGANSRESYQLGAIWVFLSVLPTYFVPFVMRDPAGGAAMALSLFPLTAPYYMPLRIAVDAAPLWQAVLSVMLLAGAIVLSLEGAARLLRAAMLLQGKRVTPGRLWRALATSPAEGRR